MIDVKVTNMYPHVRFWGVYPLVNIQKAVFFSHDLQLSRETPDFPKKIDAKKARWFSISQRTRWKDNYQTPIRYSIHCIYIYVWSQLITHIYIDTYECMQYQYGLIHQYKIIPILTETKICSITYGFKHWWIIHIHSFSVSNDAVTVTMIFW